MSAHTNEKRRHFLRQSAAFIPIVSLGGTVLHSAFADQPNAPPLESYAPVFFDAAEWTFIKAACDRLIPANADGPGALETNVPVFIDLELKGGFGAAEDWYMEGPFDPHAPSAAGYQLPYTPREVYRKGIAATSKYCQQSHQKAFDALDAAARDQVLTALEHDKIDFAQFGEPQMKASAFFSFLLQNTKEGYLADPIHGGNRAMGSWKMIGFPGARASYTEWIDQHNVPYPLGPVDLAGRRG
ncbi:gluconate 2-dehydrogenase subunit 3 family protein [Robbsia sp. Bb-Pol-6]|uniref:Gluconate 2-dehydrogenase subunit 3 family protein n=1 Tax=Robbsia betulipollinis TaxID=2981849 RepID=A0ABT3ZT43_9BURK|nr:gluconate 2-dehydrogenase subunit 3 family protein [Robbsia betulipollinis]